MTRSEVLGLLADVDLDRYEIDISYSGVDWDGDEIRVRCRTHNAGWPVAFGYTLTPMEILEGIVKHEQEKHQ